MLITNFFAQKLKKSFFFKKKIFVNRFKDKKNWFGEILRSIGEKLEQILGQKNF